MKSQRGETSSGRGCCMRAANFWLRFLKVQPISYQWAQLCSAVKPQPQKRLWWTFFTPELPVRSSLYCQALWDDRPTPRSLSVCPWPALATHISDQHHLQREALPISHCHCPSPRAQRECQDTPQYTTWCFMELHSLGIMLNIYINKITLGFQGSM